MKEIEAIRGAGAQACDSKRERLWAPFPIRENKTIRYTMPPEFGGKWGVECLNTRLPLPTLLYTTSASAGYIVKMKKKRLRISSEDESGRDERCVHES